MERGEANNIPFAPNKDLAPETQTYEFGEYMRRVAHLLKDSDKKWELVSGLENAQRHTWWKGEGDGIQQGPSTVHVQYQKTLQSWEKDLASHISGNKDPFML